MQDIQLEMVRGDRVRPIPGTFIDQRMRKNAQWLFSLDVNRLLAPMRRNCGLDDGGARPYGGWQDYYYYYLRAMCNLYVSFHGLDEEIAEKARERALALTRGMLQCQCKTAETCPEGMLSLQMEKILEERTRLVPDSIYSHFL